MTSFFDTLLNITEKRILSVIVVQLFITYLSEMACYLCIRLLFGDDIDFMEVFEAISEPLWTLKTSQLHKDIVRFCTGIYHVSVEHRKDYCTYYTTDKWLYLTHA